MSEHEWEFSDLSDYQVCSRCGARSWCPQAGDECPGRVAPEPLRAAIEPLGLVVTTRDRRYVISPKGGGECPWNVDEEACEHWYTTRAEAIDYVAGDLQKAVEHRRKQISRMSREIDELLQAAQQILSVRNEGEVSDA